MIELRYIYNLVGSHADGNYIMIIKGNYVDSWTEIVKVETKYLFIFIRMGNLLRSINLMM
jgi:hypothetical protein